MELITENHLDEWVRGNARDAQGVIVELVWRLVAASSPRPKDRRFPLGDSIGQHGADGLLQVDYSYDPFVPEGRSYWEMGTGLDAGTKATRDYRDLTAATPEDIRLESTFIFVTPLSGRRDWKGDWTKDSQGKWLNERKARSEWRDVRVIDGTRLVDWLHQLTAVELWLAKRLHIHVQQLETPEQRWEILRTIGEPPPLSATVFLTNRDQACTKLAELFTGGAVQLKLNTRYPEQVVDFVSAYIGAMDAESRADVAGRCVVVSGVDAWNEIVARRDPHVLVADPDLDLSGEKGTKLLEKARRAGHAVVYGGLPGGIPHPNSADIPNPKPAQIAECLVSSGYAEERARTLSLKSAGELGSLLRCLQNASLMPEWAEGSAASQLAVAMFLGGWNENVAADVKVVEDVSGKAYGEWIGKMRELAVSPGTPLTQRDGIWKFVQRYEGWYALGSRIFEEHLQRFRKAAVTVLEEVDPAFDLPKEERYAAQIRGKVLSHSEVLRSSLSESVALLGSHPKALTSCSAGAGEGTAAIIVRDVLRDADSRKWGSLNQLLPLLAEGAPTEFLDAVDDSLHERPTPFLEVFAQEGDGLFGRTYINGLLWALETLAWDEEYLGRAVMHLGELAAVDPGGRWENRPRNSMTAILLPWLPQTTASIARRVTSVSSLQTEHPDVAWALLLSLLPASHSFSSGTRKPEWRQSIPENWSGGATHAEFWEQTNRYCALAIQAVSSDTKKLKDLIDKLDGLPPPALEEVLALLRSDVITSLDEEERVVIWNELVDLVARHSRHADANWALPSDRINQLVAIAEGLAPRFPFFEHQRLFSERDFELYDGEGDWEDRATRLEDRRSAAMREILALGTDRIIAFSSKVQSPWRAGIALGRVATPETDVALLPKYLLSAEEALAQMTAGFVRERFRTRGWDWFHGLDLADWDAPNIAQLLAYLPFRRDVWDKASQVLKENENAYWAATNANAYEARDDMRLGAEKLLEHHRPRAAVRCLHLALHDKQKVPAELLVRALLPAARSDEPFHANEGYHIVDVIQALQADPSADPEMVSRVEWAYLPILESHRGAAAKHLQHRLANDPQFFCEVIKTVFRSKNVVEKEEVTTEDAKDIAGNAYRLLHNWKTPPGTRADGTFSREEFAAWLSEMKAECTASGHLEVAMTTLGRSLVHAPTDSSGLWIDRDVAEALDARDAGDMRNGFRTELYNSRGVHWFNAGKDELALAKTYREQTVLLDEAGFHRFASSLRELAETYELEAERAAKRDPFDE